MLANLPLYKLNQLKVVVLTGAGISAESGLKTFRDNDGLWEGHSIQDVATPEGFVSLANHYGAYSVELNLEPSLGENKFTEKHYGLASKLVSQFVDTLLSNIQRPLN